MKNNCGNAGAQQRERPPLPPENNFMPIDENLNKILKEMWRLDNKLMEKEPLELSEIKYYNQNLNIIQDYYWENNIHWRDKHRIDE